MNNNTYYCNNHFNWWDKKMNIGASGAITEIQMIFTYQQPHVIIEYYHPVIGKKEFLV